MFGHEINNFSVSISLPYRNRNDYFTGMKSRECKFKNKSIPNVSQQIKMFSGAKYITTTYYTLVSNIQSAFQKKYTRERNPTKQLQLSNLFHLNQNIKGDMFWNKLWRPLD